MALEVIPKSLYTLKNLKPILSDHRSSILRKTLHESLINLGKFISTPLIVYIRKGRQIIRDHDGFDNFVEEDHLIFLPKDVYCVSDFVADQGHFEAFLFFIDDDIIAKYLKSCPLTAQTQTAQGRQGERTYILRANEQIRRYVSSLSEVYSGGENTAALLEIKLMELLHLIAIQDKTFRFIKVLSTDKTPIQKRSITDFMENYFSHNLKLDDYALLTGRSVSTFMRDFKKAYNTTPNRWIIQRKVDMAHRLLVEQNVSVTNAALEAGYDNVSHFIKAYKRQFGVTPKKAKGAGDALQLQTA